MNRKANCHTDRKHWAKGFCRNCYNMSRDTRDMKLHRTLWNRYKISSEEFYAMIQLQNKKCKLCGEVKKLVVEHCHTTKKVRGLVCQRCNIAIGAYENFKSMFFSIKEYLNASSN